MDFGLGLVLSFTDNASAGMNGAVQSLNNLTSVAENACNSMSRLDSTASLMAVSTSANMIGNSFIRAGSGILGMFTSLINKTKQLGSEYEGFGITLNALGMDSEKAISKLFKFANKSPLEVGDVKDMIVTLQSQGVNAFDETTGAITGTRQEFLAFLTDLKSFKPELNNERFKMALQNYIGSGEKKMMRTAFDMGDIEDIIGHKVSSTAEGRMQDIVEMVENKGLTGLSKSLAESWQGVASNVSDAFTRIYYSVANQGGLFEKLKSSFVDLANIIIELPEDKLVSMGKTIGDALNIIVTPLTKIVGWAGKLVKSLIGLAQTNPKLLKFGIVITTVAGFMTVFTGVTLKLIGTLANFTIVMNNMGGTIKMVSGLFKMGFATMKTSIIPLVATIGLLALAWKTDFGGIRTMTTNFIKNITSSWQTARDIVDGSVKGLVYALDNLKAKDDFWSNLTIGFMKVYGTFKFLAEAWNTYELSDESFSKANQLGILPLITNILMLKWRFEQFVKGFKQGWKEVSNSIVSAIDEVKPKLEGTIFEGLIDKATEFFDLITGGSGKDWEDFGNKFAHFTTKAVALGVAFKVLSSVVVKVVAGAKILKTIFSSFNSFINVFGKILRPLREIKGLISGQSLVPSSKLGQAFVKIMPKILKVKDAIMGIVSVISSIGAGPVLAVAAVVMLAIGSVVAFAKTQKEKFLEMINSIKEHFSNAIEGIKSNIKTGIKILKSTFGPTIDNIKDAIGNIKDAFSNFGDGMKDSPIIKFLGLIGENIMSKVVPVLNFLIDLVGSVLGNAFVILSGIVSGVFSFLGNLFSGLINVISGIVNIISGLFSLDFEKVGDGFMQIVEGLIQSVGGLIGGLLTILESLVLALFDLGKDIIMSLVEGIKSKITRVSDLFSKVFNLAKTVVTVSMTAIKDKVSSILDKVKTSFSVAFDVVQSTVSNVFGRIKSTISNTMDSAKRIITSAIDVIKRAFNFNWKLPDLKIPHISVTGGKAPFGIAGKGELPKFDIKWYAKGGVFDSPNVIGVGEDGKEAVMPLEKNLGWIDSLASMLSSRISITPTVTPTSVDTSSASVGGTSVITKNVNNNTSNINNTNTSTTSGNVDNSVHFEAGSIVIQAKDFSNSEAEEFVKLIISKIKRQREIDKMLQYQA